MMMNERILVTGARGFLGKHLTRALLAGDAQPIFLSRNPENIAAEFSGIESILWDFESEMRNLPACLAVIHLAGESIFGKRWTSSQKEKLRTSRIRSTKYLVRAMSSAPVRPKVFVCASAIGIYGDRGEELLDENSSEGTDFLAQLCWDWETEALKARELAIRTVTLRTGIVLGDGGALKQMLPPFRLGLGGCIGRGKQWMSWIHIEDVIALILKSLSNDRIQGPINLTAPNPVTNEDFTKNLATTLRRPALLPVPLWALRTLLGESSEVLIASQRALPKVALDNGYGFKYPELKNALIQILRCDESIDTPY